MITTDNTKDRPDTSLKANFGFWNSAASCESFLSFLKFPKCVAEVASPETHYDSGSASQFSSDRLLDFVKKLRQVSSENGPRISFQWFTGQIWFSIFQNFAFHSRSIHKLNFEMNTPMADSAFATRRNVPVCCLNLHLFGVLFELPECRDFFCTPFSPQIERRFEARLFRQKRHIPIGNRRSTPKGTEIPWMMLQHGDFFDDPTVSAASVLRECLTADEELGGSFSVFKIICPCPRCRDRFLGARS